MHLALVLVEHYVEMVKSVTVFEVLSLITVCPAMLSPGVHKNGFIVFITSALIHMAITCRLWQVIKKYSLSPEVE